MADEVKRKIFRTSAFWSAALSLLCCAAGCGDAETGADGKLGVAAGLPPVAYLAKRVGGDAVTVRTMLPEGRSPHDFSPGPREVRDAAACRVFFTTGMRFEDALVKAVGGGKTVDVSRGIRRIPMLVSCDHDHGRHHDHDHHDHHHDHDGEEALDPHIWLDAENACRMAANIRDELSALDPGRASLYRENCERTTRELRALEKRLQVEFSPFRGRCFYVYHPAFGYFAKMLGLRQEAVELGGREVTPARLTEVIRKARRDKVKVLFAQPQFSPASCRALERALGVKVVPADPLREDLLANFEHLAKELKAGFAESDGGARDSDN